MQKEDFHFTIATARSYFSAKTILKELKLKLPVILFNGAFITNFETGKHQHIFDIEKEYLMPLMEIINKANCHTFISACNNGEDHVYYNETPNAGMQWFLNDRKKAKDPRLKNSGDLALIFKEKILSINVIDKLEVIEPLSNLIRKTYGDELYFHHYINPYDKEFYWLTINCKVANKGDAIKFYCKQYGYEIENTTVFGDNLNDIEMVSEAGMGVCPSNAIDEAKAVANKIIDSNEENAIVKYILEHS